MDWNNREYRWSGSIAEIEIDAYAYRVWGQNGWEGYAMRVFDDGELVDEFESLLSSEIETEMSRLAPLDRWRSVRLEWRDD